VDVGVESALALSSSEKPNLVDYRNRNRNHNRSAALDSQPTSLLPRPTLLSMSLLHASSLFSLLRSCLAF
jgi:hypothetical protein